MNNNDKIILSVIGMIMNLGLIITSATMLIILIVISMILVFIYSFYATKIDYERGIYECRKCGHTFKPALKTYILGAHIPRTRYLKCPGCEEKSWCKGCINVYAIS